MSIIGPRPGDVESKDTYAEDEKDTIVTAISDIVIGLITESVSDGKMTIKENIKFWSFKKKIKKGI